MMAMLLSTEPTMSTTTSSMIEKPDLRSFMSIRSLEAMIDHAWTFREFRAMQKTQEPHCFFDVPKLGPGKFFLARAQNTPSKRPSL